MLPGSVQCDSAGWKLSSLLPTSANPQFGPHNEGGQGLKQALDKRGNLGEQGGDLKYIHIYL